MGEESTEERKFRILGTTKEEFNRLPVAERLGMLRELETRTAEEREIEARTKSELISRYRNVERSLEEARERYWTLRTTRVRIAMAERRYREAVHEERACIGRIGAYTRLYRRAVAEHDEERARHYAELLRTERARLPELRERVAIARETLASLPDVRTVSAEIEETRRLINYYRRRLDELYNTYEYASRRWEELDKLLEEVRREIKELEVIPVVIQHKYREVDFELHKSLEYSSREKGHDIDIELTLSGTFKTLLPTAYSDDECLWLADIEVPLRNAVCEIMDDCLEDAVEGYGITIPIETEIRCNVVGREIVRKTVVDVTEYYAKIEPPLTDVKLRDALKREIDNYSFIKFNSVTFRRAHTLGEPKTINYDAGVNILHCMRKRSDEALRALIDWTEEHEHQEIKNRLTGGT